MILDFLDKVFKWVSEKSTILCFHCIHRYITTFKAYTKAFTQFKKIQHNIHTDLYSIPLQTIMANGPKSIYLLDNGHDKVMI